MPSLAEKIKAKKEAALKKETEKKKIQPKTKLEEEKKAEDIIPKGLNINYFELPKYKDFLEYVRAHPKVLKDLCLEDKPTKKNPKPKPFDKVERVWSRIVDDTIKVYRQIVEDIIQGKWSKDA